MTNDLFARLFVESRDALRRYVRRLVPSVESAEEIVQEAYLRTYEKRGRAAIPRAYLFATARRLVSDHLSGERERCENSLEEVNAEAVVDPAPPQQEMAIADEASRLVKQAIELLPPQRHAAVTLRLLHGYSLKEIGAVLGISRKTAEKHVALGMARVTEYLRARYSGGQDG